MRSVPFRYDSPDQTLTKQAAVRAMFGALRTHRPAAIQELRDLERHPMEGVHNLERLLAEQAREIAPRKVPSERLVVVARIEQVEEPIAPTDSLHSRAARPSFRRFIIAEEEISDPVVVVFVPAPVEAWLQKWRLACDELAMAAVLIRAQWVRRPDAAKACTILMSSLPQLLRVPQVTLLGEAQWSSLGQSPIGANPMLETAEQFLRRAQEHYRTRALAYENSAKHADIASAGPFVPSRQRRQLDTHAEWLVRVQAGDETPASLARGSSEKVTRQTVDEAVRQLAGLVGLPLRAMPRRGRRPDVREMTPRRRQKKQD